MSFSQRIFSGILLTLILSAFAGRGSFGTARAQTREVDPQTIDSFIQSQMKTVGFPGLAISVIQNGKVTLQKGYGTSSTGEAITPQSSLYIGSVSKSFTALAAMRLWDQGKIDLDAPVITYLPDFRLADEKESRKITLRQLLNQSSGICGKR